MTFHQSDSFPREDHKQFYVYDSMPHVSSSGGDDLAPPDEVKVYNDEGEQEEQRTSEDISEEKIGLVTETEQVCAVVPFTSNTTNVWLPVVFTAIDEHIFGGG